MDLLNELKDVIARFEAGGAPVAVTAGPPFLYPASPRYGSKDSQADIGRCNPLDLAEVEARLAEGYTYAGNRAKWGPGIDAADAEIRRLWAMPTPEYQKSRYRRVEPRFACGALKANLIAMPGANPINPQNLDVFEGVTIESFLAEEAKRLGLAGPSGG